MVTLSFSHRSTSNDEVSDDLKNGSNVAMISSNMTDTKDDDISDVPSKPENDSVNKKDDENENVSTLNLMSFVLNYVHSKTVLIITFCLSL